MIFDKKFDEKKIISESELSDFTLNFGEIIPSDYIEFLTQFGGISFYQGEGELCFSKNGITPDFVFYMFYTIDEIKAEIEIINFKGDKFNHIPLNKYFWIGEGERQNYLAIGNCEENYNQIFWYEDQELKVHFVCEGLENLINNHIIEFSS